MAKYATPEWRAAFAEWGRRKGVPMPSTEEGIRVLFARFLVEMQTAAAKAADVNIGAAGDNAAYGMDPLAHADHKINILRDSGGLTDIADPENEDSDFGELIRKQAAAMEEAGGDDLAASAILKGQAKSAAAAVAPPTNTNPPSSVDAILGQQATPTVSLVNGVSVPGIVEVARWTGTNNESTNVTITCQPTGNFKFTSSSSHFSTRTYAVVQYGSFGNMVTIEVDIGQGCQFTVGASSVVVSIGIDIILDNTTVVNNFPILIGFVSLPIIGFLTFKQITKNSPMTRTRYIDFLNNTTVGPFYNATIPPYAKALRIVLNDKALTVPPTFTFVGIQPGNIYTIDTSKTSYSPNVAYPVPSDALSVITAGIAVASSSAQLIFELGV